MKPIWILLLSLFCLSQLTAQQNNLRLHAISGGFGIASSSSETAGSGFGINLDFSLALQKNIFSFYFNSGWELTNEILSEEFYELNLTYGRLWELGDRWTIEGHLGIGWFAYEVDAEPDLFFDFPDNDIGFPFRVKLIYRPSDRIGLGLNPNVNFNSIETAYSGNILIQYYFR